MLREWGWSIAESFYPDPVTGRLVWVVCCLRGSEMIQARGETETACFVEAVRQAIEQGMVDDRAGDLSEGP